MITYHNTVKNAIKFKEFLIKINNLLYEGEEQDGNVFIDSIDGTTSMAKRKRVIGGFVKNKRGIMCSARVLNEGVNIPCVDSVCFVDNRKSTIDIIQCIGRALRLFKNKQMAYVFVPTIIESLDEEFNKDKYGNVIRILKALKSTDEGVSEYFMTRGNVEKVTGRKIFRAEGFIKMYKSYEIELHNWENTIKERIWEIVDSFSNMLQKISMWIDKNKKRPGTIAKNIEERTYGQFISHENQNYKNSKKGLSNTNRRHKWEKFIEKYKIYFLTNTENWHGNFVDLSDWMGKNNKRPSQRSNNKIERFLGVWVCAQQRHYKTKKGLFKNATIWNTWHDFLKNNSEIMIDKDDIWYENLKTLKEYTMRHRKKPSHHSRNKEEKRIGTWLTDQQKHYKKKTGSMKEQEKYDIFGVFLNENKQILLSFNERWNLKFERVKMWMSKNKRKPSCNSNDNDEKEVGVWINTQLINLKKNLYAMKDSEKKLLWENFYNENKKILAMKNDEWSNKLFELSEWIKKEGRRPSKVTKNEVEKNLHYWLANQLIRYKKQVGVTKNSDKMTEWEKFLKENKHLFSDKTKTLM